MESYSTLWIDKYQPRSIDTLDARGKSLGIIDQISKSNDFPHLIFYGADGVGKKTRIRALLQKIFGAGVYKAQVSCKELKVNSSTIEYQIISSNYHLEMTPSDSGNQDRLLIQKTIKDTASTGNIEATKTSKSFKVIVIHEADFLSKEAQAALRRTMEKYSALCRIILSCNSLTKIIGPIRSRCLAIRIPAPSVEELKTIVKNIAFKENRPIDDKFLNSLIEKNGRNIRKVINSFQISSSENSKEPFTPLYFKSIRNLAEKMYFNNFHDVSALRDAMFDLLCSGVTFEIIIKELIKCFGDISKGNDVLMKKIIHWGATYDFRMVNGLNAIYHLEAFLARVMLILSDHK